MKETKYSKIARALRVAEDNLRALALHTNDLPETFKQRLIQLAEELKGHHTDQYREPLVAVTGDVLTLEAVKELVVEASAYTKWDAEEAYEGGDLGVEAETFRDSFGLDVKDGDVKVYEFHRETRNRNAVHWLVISCIPGMIFISFSTDRAGMSCDVPMPNDDAGRFLKKDVFEED